MKLGTQVVDEVRRRVRQDQLGRRLYRQQLHRRELIEEPVLDTIATCPIPEVDRLGRTLRA